MAALFSLTIGLDGQGQGADLLATVLDRGSLRGVIPHLVMTSLFADARATVDELEDPGDDPRGWWADGLDGDDPGKWGSKLWLLERATTTQAQMTAARQYALDALGWLVTDGIASAVDVEAARTTDQIRLRVTLTQGRLYPELWEALRG